MTGLGFGGVVAATGPANAVVTLPQHVDFDNVPATGTVGDSFTISGTANVLGVPTGKPVTFSTNSLACSVGTSSGSQATVTFTHLGTCVVKGHADGKSTGNPQYTNANDFTDPIEVDTKGTQTITGFTAPATDTVGGSYTLSATGGASGKPVIFDVQTPGVCSESGNHVGDTITFTHVGTCTVRATQGGTADYTKANGVSQSTIVSQGSQTIDFPQLPNGVVNGSDQALATATSGLTVTFALDPATTTNNACTVSTSGSISYNHAGVCGITASQAGNADYSAATPVTQQVTVDKAPQVVTITSTPKSNYTPGDSYRPTATGGASGNPVYFVTNTPGVCEVTPDGRIRFLDAGTCRIRAQQDGNADYAAGHSAPQIITVKFNQGIKFTTSPPVNPVVGGSYNVAAVSTSGLPVSFSIGNKSTNGACTITGSKVHFKKAGTCVIVADQAGDSDYYAAPSAKMTFVIRG